MRSHQPASINYQTNTGGAVTSWAINASLPTGLTFSTTNGSIYGTQTELWTQTAYMVWANNSGGSSVAYLNITVVDELPTLSYSPENLTLTKGQSSTDLPLNATITGSGAITSWAISPALPSGLNFGTSNGTVWGIPTVLQTTAVTYTIWANNSGGSENATINITINDVAPSISYSLDDIVATLNVSISPHSSPTKTGGAVTSWEISPDPGPAFHFNTFNGVISGTPGILLSRTQYTVYANNSGGSSFAYVNVTINDQLPTLSYTPENLTLTKGQASSDLPLNATVSGSGTITSWAISSALPSGLSFGTSNGTIWGTPTSLMTLKTFTVWANNTGGSSSATINITVNDEAPDISYSSGTYTSSNNTVFSPSATVTNVGGAIPSGVLATNGDLGRYASLSIDSMGYHHISHYNLTGSSLMYTTDKSGTWVTIAIDIDGIVGKYCSLSIDSNDNIHISYYDDTNDDLKYATDKSGTWVNSTIDSYEAVGLFTSLDIDSNDKIHISYYDHTNDDLKYITELPVKL